MAAQIKGIVDSVVFFIFKSHSEIYFFNIKRKRIVYSIIYQLIFLFLTNIIVKSIVRIFFWVISCNYNFDSVFYFFFFFFITLIKRKLVLEGHVN